MSSIIFDPTKLGFGHWFSSPCSIRSDKISWNTFNTCDVVRSSAYIFIQSRKLSIYSLPYFAIFITYQISFLFNRICVKNVRNVNKNSLKHSFTSFYIWMMIIMTRTVFFIPHRCRIDVLTCMIS